MHLVYVVTTPEEFKKIQECRFILRKKETSGPYISSPDPHLFEHYKKGDDTNVNTMEGVHLQIWSSLQMKQPNTVVFDLQWSVLDHFDWYFNTTDNHGFIIYDNVSLFTGDPGITLYNLYDINAYFALTNDEKIEFGELVLPNTDLSLDVVKQVV